MARDLGMTVRELVRRLDEDPDEFVQWKALYMVERTEREHEAKKRAQLARKR